MTDIPEDVMKAASDAALSPKVPGARFTHNYVIPIARAILAERERCARVADDEKEMRQRLYRDNAAPLNAHKAEQAEAIADAIRNGVVP